MSERQEITPKQTADRMAQHASRLRQHGPFTGVATDRMLDDGADLIVHQAAEIERLRAALDPFQWHIPDDDDNDGCWEDMGNGHQDDCSSPVHRGDDEGNDR